METKKNQLSFTCDEFNQLTLTISGKLDQNFLTTIWDIALKLQARYQPKLLIIDAKNITECDSIGAVLILEIKKRQLDFGHKFCLENCPEKIANILAFLDTKQSIVSLPHERVNLIVKAGMFIGNTLKNIRENIAFLGLLIINIIRTFYSQKDKSTRIRWQDFWRVIEEVGPQAIPIIILIGLLVGLITTFQSANPLGRFGAQIYIIDLVGLGLVREMGPLMASVLIAGRTASAFAAEIGTMKINQEIDALTTMGIEPIKFLVIPRILATMLLAPLLSIFLITSGLLGCLLVMKSLGYSFNIFLARLNNTILLNDFFSGLIKTFVFGAVIASIGCLHGIKTNFGASAVGRSTTKAVVTSLIMLVVVDGVFALIYYAMGV